MESEAGQIRSKNESSLQIGFYTKIGGFLSQAKKELFVEDFHTKVLM